MTDKKVGFYDWIASYQQLKPLLPANGIEQRSKLKALTIGCGTSLFTELYSRHYGAHHDQILAIDNDEGCIEHMKASLSSSTVEYRRLDIIEETGALPEDSFDYIYDKGTFDAIHVEGSTAILLLEINRLLVVNGLFVLASINTSELITSLFSIQGLGFAVDSIKPIPNTSSILAVIRKTAGCSIDIDLLSQEEVQIENAHYKSAQSSMLTADRMHIIQRAFINKNALSLVEAHRVMFEEELGYDFDLFLSDLKNFPLQKTGQMTLTETLDFIKAME